MFAGTMVIEDHTVAFAETAEEPSRMRMTVCNSANGRCAYTEVTHPELGAVVALAFGGDGEFSVETQGYLYTIAEPVMARLEGNGRERWPGANANDWRIIP